MFRTAIKSSKIRDSEKCPEEWVNGVEQGPIRIFYGSQSAEGVGDHSFQRSFQTYSKTKIFVFTLLLGNIKTVQAEYKICRGYDIPSTAYVLSTAHTSDNCRRVFPIFQSMGRLPLDRESIASQNIEIQGYPNRYP